MVLTLERAGFLKRNLSRGTYSLGLKLLELGAVALGSVELRARARPHLERLHRDTGLTVHLAILDAGEVVYIDKIEGDTAVRLYSQVGRRAPAHCTALGKALLAHMAQEKVCEILAVKGMRRYTPDTIVSVPAFVKELEIVRERGYAVDMREHEPLVHCVAAPIRDHTGSVVAALSVTIIAAEMSEDDLSHYAELVMAAAAAVSRDMGYYAEAGTVCPGSGKGRVECRD
jgi:DNA-binding IclR family transcriptional regulator